MNNQTREQLEQLAQSFFGGGVEGQRALAEQAYLLGRREALEREREYWEDPGWNITGVALEQRKRIQAQIDALKEEK